jgi:hypothetical protein
MQRKQLGKICRKAPVLPLSVTAAFPARSALANKFNTLCRRRGMARRSHRLSRVAVHGSGEVIRQVF